MGKITIDSENRSCPGMQLDNSSETLLDKGQGNSGTVLHGSSQTMSSHYAHNIGMYVSYMIFFNNYLIIN